MAAAALAVGVVAELEALRRDDRLAALELGAHAYGVARALADLPPRQRAVVALRDLDGYTAEEVSALLGITSGNQRVLLHRGRAVVRSRLEHYYDDARRSSGEVVR